MPVRFCFPSIPSCQSGAAALRSPPDFALPSSRRPPLFAPRSPQTLVSPFRGAKSSHSRRRFLSFRAPGGLLSLLLAPREPLCLRLGEQNLHIPAAGFRPSARPAASSLCSPTPANPCASVPGSKIFTFPPPDFALPSSRRSRLFAPRSPLSLVASFRGAKSSHSSRRLKRHRILLFHAPDGPLSLLPGLNVVEMRTPGRIPFRLAEPPPCAQRRRRCVSRHAGTSGGRPRQRKCCRAPPLTEKAPGSAIAARCFSLFSLSIIPIPLLPPAQS